ncbi:MAG: hypothetical protein M0020_08135 [Actinomycetota bacterium]|jgi:hypothetical protein|nr:hypothetical protein [Actinomycetota bacterium]
MTTIEEVGPAGNGPSVTPVALGRPRGGPDVPTLRPDRWWIQPTVIFLGLTAFVAYSTWAAFINKDYFHAPYISPFYSPCISSNCTYQQLPIIGTWWSISPSILIVAFPLGFRLTCYYYRKAYYRSFWWSPPACAVADAHPRYSGETRFPLIMQNVHRWFFYAGAVFVVFLGIDAVRAYDFPGGWGMGLGSLILTANVVLLGLYTFSCHACRHLAGGGLRGFSGHKIRHWLWKRVSVVNAHHMLFAWLSLIFVAFTDVYVRLVASGVITDPRFF